MKRFLSVLMLLLLILSCGVAQALEVVRQKNVASYVTFPMIDAADDVAYDTGATGLDSEWDGWADGSAPNGFTDCTNEATEIGTSGIYYLSLTATELNNDYIIIQVKSTSANTQSILVRTMVADPLLMAATDDGGVINVTGGAVDTVTNVTTVNGLAANVITASSIAAAAITSSECAPLQYLTGDAYVRLGAPAGASIAADIAAVKSDTAAILTDTAAMDTSGELRTLLFGSDTPGGTAANQSTIIGYIDTEIADIPTNSEMAAAFTEIKGATWSSLTDTLENIRDKQTDIETDTQDLQTQVGTDGAGLTSLPWNASWDAEVQSEATDALNAYDPPTNAEMTAAAANVSVDELQATALADLFNTNSGTTYASAVAGSAAGAPS